MNPEDFRRVLARRARSRSAHFALHHLGERPVRRCQPAPHRLSTELSTGQSPLSGPAVDGSVRTALAAAPGAAAPGGTGVSGHWLGLVVPKRYARRAVTRTLIKREMRQLAGRHLPGWPAGMVVLRLVSGFERTAFPSAASPALRNVVRDELQRLLERRPGAGHA